MVTFVLLQQISQNAMHKLKPDKSDGSLGSNSNHFIYGPNQLNVLISLLFTAMLTHGYAPDDMLKSVIISIPKDYRASLQNSANYRGINSFFSSLCKLFDHILLNKYRDELRSSNMQYGFKSSHSTAICTSVVKETIQYYTHNKSNVYACLLDASKAFDRLHFGRLFLSLFKRKLPAVIIRMLFQSYVNQNVEISWNGVLSDPIYPTNGVKQGGVLSPILFCIYLDELLQLLSQSGYGCKIGRSYFGVFSYADDIILLSPTLKGLQSMLDICNDFGIKYHIKFNEKKTQCIIFGPASNCRDVYLGKEKLSWVNKVKYLGSWLDNGLNNDDDLMYKKGIYFQSVNKLYLNFSFLSRDIERVRQYSYT
jgi:hypothetical protein